MEMRAATRTEALGPLGRAIAAGHSALLVAGNIHDLRLVDGEMAYWPYFLADQLAAQGYLVIRYSKSQAGRIHQYSQLNPKEKQALDSRLNALGLLSLLTRDCQSTPEEIRSFFRGATRLLQLPAGDARPIAVIVDYTENLAPMVASSGSRG